MSRFLIRISPSGSVIKIYDDADTALMQMGAASVRRASHVEPDPRGGWSADMSPVGGGILGPFQLRQEALHAEVEYLEQNLIFGGNTHGTTGGTTYDR